LEVESHVNLKNLTASGGQEAVKKEGYGGLGRAWARARATGSRAFLTRATGREGPWIGSGEPPLGGGLLKGLSQTRGLGIFNKHANVGRGTLRFRPPVDIGMPLISRT